MKICFVNNKITNLYTYINKKIWLTKLAIFLRVKNVILNIINYYTKLFFILVDKLIS